MDVIILVLAVFRLAHAFNLKLFKNFYIVYHFHTEPHFKMTELTLYPLQ